MWFGGKADIMIKSIPYGKSWLQSIQELVPQYGAGGDLQGWATGIWEYRMAGILEYWITGILKYWMTEIKKGIDGK